MKINIQYRLHRTEEATGLFDPTAANNPAHIAHTLNIVYFYAIERKDSTHSLISFFSQKKLNTKTLTTQMTP